MNRNPTKSALRLVLSIFSAALFLAVSAHAEPSEPPELLTFELVEHAPAAGGGSEVALSILSEGDAPDHLLAARLKAGGLLPNFLGGMSWSPDGSEIAFAAEARAEVASSRAIYLMDADGSGLRRLPGTRGGADPVFAPDGSTLAFSRSKLRLPKLDPTRFPPTPGHSYSSTTTWLLDLPAGEARQLTAWRNGLDVTPGSFSPDGSTLAMTRRDRHRRGPEVLLMPLAGGPPRILAHLAEEPVFSPDGDRLAIVGYRNAIKIDAEENKDYLVGELYSIDTTGMGLRRLTRNRGIESSPSWDSSGSRLAFVEARPDDSWIPGLANLFPFGNRIRKMTSDGSCLRSIRSAPNTALYGVRWNPSSDVPASSC
jgi:Tol biopolymer transport system component